MAISASRVKELRESTGLGMMECKKALEETAGDMEAAIAVLRKKAGARVEKRAGKTTAEGVISIRFSSDKKTVAMVEVNSETDFVAKGSDFLEFANNVAGRAAAVKPADIAVLLALPLWDDGGETVSKALEALGSKLGENISVRRFTVMESDKQIGNYVHGGKIGVLVEINGGDETLAHDIAMHIAASRPQYISGNDVPADVIVTEKEIFNAQAKESGKPDNIIEKMVAGRINKYLNEICLLGQPFVKDPDAKVEKLLNSAGAEVVRFCRYEVGEGLKKRGDDFAAEVMAQVEGG